MKHELGNQISTDEYTRERLEPKHGDSLYLHLSDLRQAMERVRTDESIRILDYGCGGSPYRSLFPNAEYKRADYLESPGLDYIVDEYSKVDEKDAAFDMILSTQVLEHVRSVDAYLSEAGRLLRPGGELVCTTHGTYEEHGCPDDYWRWTGFGLAKEIEQRGFEVTEVLRLTTGPRAVLFLTRLYRTRFGSVPNNEAGQALYVLLNSLHTQPHVFHAWCDELYAAHRVTASSDPEHRFYIALLVRARKKKREGTTHFSFTPHSVID